jgi:2-(3-amino-3-carboxypropyl)histidine synthase
VIKVEKEKLFFLIEKNRPKSIALSAPEGLINILHPIAEEIERKYSIDVFILSEPNYGICDIEPLDVKKLRVDMLFNFGHKIKSERFGKSVFMLGVEYDVSFDDILPSTVSRLKELRIRNVGIFTISNHLSRLKEVKDFMTSRRITVLEPVDDPVLERGQVFGCNYAGPLSIKDKVDAFLFLGQSRFHAIGIYLTTRKPTFMLDPFFKEIVDISEDAKRVEKRAMLAVLKAKDAERFGIITGLRGSQMQRVKSLFIKKELEGLDKKVVIFAMREITPLKVNQLSDFDAFIVTACPRIALDDLGYNRPMLSYIQALSLIKLLKKGEVGNIFEEGVWV